MSIFLYYKTILTLKIERTIFGPGFSHSPARAGKLGRVLDIWAGSDENGPGF